MFQYFSFCINRTLISNINDFLKNRKMNVKKERSIIARKKATDVKDETINAFGRYKRTIDLDKYD